MTVGKKLFCPWMDLRIYDNVEEIATRLSLFQRKL